jgi:3-hydroxyisobutyrate dehydrogenase-like beta-hydroxyacid dehydrogenase
MGKTGYIGLGAMGGAMARNLVRHGRDLIVFDTVPARRLALIDEGAAEADSAAQVAAECEIVFTSLPGAPEVEAVYAGPNGIAEGARPGLLAVDMSTVPASTSQRMHARLQASGSSMLDAPVARTKAAAENGTLAIMVGGTVEDFQRALPYLQQMGASISHLGPIGAGNVAKLVNNAVLMSNIVAAAEGLIVGAKAGLDPHRLAAMLSEGSADSFALRNHIQQSVLEGRFEAGRFPLTYALKDLTYFFQCARDVAATCPDLTAMADIYRAAADLGYDEEYFPVAVRVLDQENKTSISSPGSPL